jgi:hypothetical protein
VESWYVMHYLGKIPNMVYKNLVEKIFTKNSTKQDFNWLSTQLTMVCASLKENFWILTPFLAEMCIFLWPTTFVTRIFWISNKKWIFYFISAQKGQNMWFLWSGYQGQGAELHHSNFHM